MGTIVLFDYKQQDHQVGGLAWPCGGQGGAAGVGPGPWGPSKGPVLLSLQSNFVCPALSLCSLGGCP